MGGGFWKPAWPSLEPRMSSGWTISPFQDIFIFRTIFRSCMVFHRVDVSQDRIEPVHGMREGKLRPGAPLARGLSAPASAPRAPTVCSARPAGPGQAVLALVPSSPAPVPRRTSPTTGEEVGETDREKSWARPPPPHSPPPALPGHADPGGSGPQDPGVRGRVPVPPSGPRLGGGTRRAGKTTAPPAPRQPLPPLRPWRSGRRRLLYIIAAGQVGCLIRAPGRPARPSRHPQARPRVPNAPGPTEARGGPGSPLPGPPPSPRGPGSRDPRPRRSSRCAQPSPPPLPSCHAPGVGGTAAPPRTRPCAEAGGLFIWRPPPPLRPGGPAPPAPRGALGPDKLASWHGAAQRGGELL
ncbi:PREDICTED: formin-like protein 5 [Ceratotherium simum simum]|uniref:Formin-like protein 5 n=1 Tax=Ceratotherium simum simum TaxID=73337 RepID=A0ABM1DI01_CERSS|nr:PREDICTED: formin-like protein 5 [Ceratotherium simum simum]